MPRAKLEAESEMRCRRYSLRRQNLKLKLSRGNHAIVTHCDPDICARKLKHICIKFLVATYNQVNDPIASQTHQCSVTYGPQFVQMFATKHRYLVLFVFSHSYRPNNSEKFPSLFTSLISTSTSPVLDPAPLGKSTPYIPPEKRPLDRIVSVPFVASMRTPAING